MIFRAGRYSGPPNLGTLMNFFLGVDAGATKTHALLSDREGNILGFGEGGCGNHEVNGFEGTRESVRSALDGAVSEAGIQVRDIRRASFCMAGADVPCDYLQIPQLVLEPLLKGVPFHLRNDAFGCLRGGTLDPFGIMLNCGSGQVAVGRNRAGMEIRVGGYGFDFGDFAGGNVITHAAAAAVVRADDGRGEPTQLVDLVLAASGQPNVSAFIDRAYRDDRWVWNLAVPKLVFKASKLGDHVARRILLSVAEELIVTAKTLIRRLRMENDRFDLVTAGSVFKGEDPVFLDTIREAVHSLAPGANFRMPLYPPVAGALLLALEEEGIEATPSVYANLSARFSPQNPADFLLAETEAPPS
jgi:N-acetylglucosamine kinase-like BadF-type ATPase